MLRSQRGFTLIEVLVGATLALIVFSAVLALVLVGIRKQGAISGSIDSLSSARVGEERLVRELRQAKGLSVPNAQTALYTLPSGATVTWACASSGTCTRTTGGVTRTAMTGVSNPAVFSPTGTNLGYVTVTFLVGDTTISDGVSLRNVTSPGS